MSTTKTEQTDSNPTSRTLATIVASLALLSVSATSRIEAQTESRADSAGWFSIGSAQTMLGYIRFDFADLDARFASAGLPKVASEAGAIGLGADVRVGRALFGAGLQSLLAHDRTDAAYRTRMWGSVSMFDFGYAIVAVKRTAIYPIVGVGATHIAVNVKERGDFVFDDGLHTPGRELGMSGASGLVHAGILVEQRFRSHSSSEFALGIRLGMTRSIGTQAWRSDESRVEGGPSGVRGSYLRIAFSKPLASRRDAALPIAGTLLQSVLR